MVEAPMIDISKEIYDLIKKRKIKKIFKNVKSAICTRMQKQGRHLLYSLIFICAVGLIWLSFFVTNNWVNVCSGVGTGLFTSLVVSVIINAENNAREKRKRDEEKHFVLNDIIEISLDVYEDVIYRINEFITMTSVYEKPIYELYKNFSIYNDFEAKLEAFDISTATADEKERLQKLFNFENYRIDLLVAELKRLPKSEYYLRGILTQEECNNLISNYANDTYLAYAARIQSFDEDSTKSKEDCIEFLRMTVFICAKTISCFSYSQNKAKGRESVIQERISQLYYDEIYLRSDEYIEEQIQIAEAEEEYYAAHPEEFERREREWEELLNETTEDRVLKNLYCCICGFSVYGIDELLAKLNAESPKAIAFLRTKQIQKSLKKKRKLNKAVVRKFGKDYRNKKIDIEI